MKRILFTVVFIFISTCGFSEDFDSFLSKARSAKVIQSQIDYYQKAIQSWTGQPEDWKYKKAYYELAVKYLEANQNQKALDTIHTLLRLDPAYSKAYVLMGEYYRKMGDADRSLQSFKKGADSTLDFFSNEPYISQLVRNGALKDAESLIKSKVNAIQKNINSDTGNLEYHQANQARYLGQLAWTCLEQNDFDQAYKRAKQAYKAFPGNNNFWILSYYYQSCLWKMRQSLADENYKQALSYLTEIKSIENKNQTVKKNLQSWELDTLITFLKRRIRLGNIKPVATHRMLIMTLPFVDYPYQDSTTNIHFQATLPDTARERIRLTQEFARVMTEVMSEGHLSLDFVYLDSQSVITRLELYPDSYSISGIYWEHITHWPSQQIFDEVTDIDSIVYYWPGIKGHSRTAYGGLMQPMIIPYHLYAPTRGRVVIPGTWLEAAGMNYTLIHEWFHNIEQTVGIWPSHGYFEKNSKSFPQYKGKNQWEYYEWHFQSTLPSYKWSNLNWSMRAPLNISQHTFDLMNRLYHKKDLSIYHQAHALYKKSQKQSSKTQLDTLKQVLILQPGHQNALEDLAYSYKKLKKYAESAQYFTELIRLYPHEAKYLLELTKNAGRQKKYSSMSDYAAKYKEATPDEAREVIKDMESFFWSEKDSSLKIEIATAMTRLDPGYYRPWYFLGMQEFWQNKYQAAFTNLTISLSKYDRDPDVLLYMGRTLDKLGRTNKSIAYFNKAVHIDPSKKEKISTHYYFRASESSQKQHKMKMYLSSLQWDPGNEESHYRLGWIYYDAGQKQKALMHFKKAADLGHKMAKATIKKYFDIHYIAKKIKVPSLYKIAIYDNDATGAVTRILDAYPELFSYKVLRSAHMTPAVLQQYNALIVGGGMAPYHARDLKMQGMDAIRTYIEGGGHYLGICAGSFLTLDHKNMLKVIKAKPKNVKDWFRGTGYATLSMTGKGSAVFSDDKMELRYANGPLFEISDNITLPDYEVLAVYTSDMHKHQAPREIMPGTAAIITTAYGTGRILLFSPHPEYTAGYHHMIKEALMWMINKK